MQLGGWRGIICRHIRHILVTDSKYLKIFSLVLGIAHLWGFPDKSQLLIYALLHKGADFIIDPSLDQFAAILVKSDVVAPTFAPV